MAAKPVPGSVLVLDDEVGAAYGSGQLRLLASELERGEFRGYFHPVGELEPDRPFPGVVDGVHHVDRQTVLVEDIGDPNVLDLERGRFERARGDDDAAFFLRIRFTQSRVAGALLAGSMVKTWPYLFLKYRASFARRPASAAAAGDDSRPTVDT